MINLLIPNPQRFSESIIISLNLLISRSHGIYEALYNHIIKAIMLSEQPIFRLILRNGRNARCALKRPGYTQMNLAGQQLLRVISVW